MDEMKKYECQTCGATKEITEGDAAPICEECGEVMVPVEVEPGTDELAEEEEEEFEEEE